jgi:hypothetical protein
MTFTTGENRPVKIRQKYKLCKILTDYLKKNALRLAVKKEARLEIA